MTFLIIAGIATGAILVGLVHGRLARLEPVWPGAIIPALWGGTAIMLVAAGSIHSIVDMGGVLLVSVVILRIWHDGRQKRTARSAPTAAVTTKV